MILNVALALIIIAVILIITFGVWLGVRSDNWATRDKLFPQQVGLFASIGLLIVAILMVALGQPPVT